MTDLSLNSDTPLSQADHLNATATTAGQMLREARLSAGLHIAALAVTLRVPVKRIEALENGQMDLLPGTVFVRALASSICQALKIDPTPILDKLPKAGLPRLNRDDVALNTPIGKPTAKNDTLLSGVLSASWFIGFIFLCIGALSIYFWPKNSLISLPESAIAFKSTQDMGTSQAKEVQVSTDMASAANPRVNAPDTVAVTTGVTAVTAATNTTPTTATTTVPDQISPTTSLAQGSVVQAGVVQNAASSPANTVQTNVNLISFKASGQTWVEVKNASGTTVLKKLLNTGDVAGASGALPLTVIVGKADATQIEVRGKPVDLTPMAKNNVARFVINMNGAVRD
jgi:cytoskeleton protein RodZ